MSESDVGVSTALTSQKGGSPEYVWPFGAVNDGPGTVTAEVIVVSGRLSVTRVSHVAANPVLAPSVPASRSDAMSSLLAPAPMACDLFD